MGNTVQGVKLPDEWYCDECSKQIREKIARILNESNCGEKAIEFSNQNKDNSGAYLGFLEGARYMAEFIEKSKSE